MEETQICRDPERQDWNANCAPSGERLGAESCALEETIGVSCVPREPPDTVMRWMPKIAEPCTKARSFPFGEMAGWVAFSVPTGKRCGAPFFRETFQRASSPARLEEKMMDRLSEDHAIP